MVSRAIVDTRLATALEGLFYYDSYLLEMGASEWCIAARLGLYLQGVFPGYAVDVEYNRLGKEPKRIALPDECTNKRNAQGLSGVYPDLVVHKRGPEGPNILALEIKKSKDPRTQHCDRLRAQAYCHQLGYQHAATILLTIPPGTPPVSAKVWWYDES